MRIACHDGGASMEGTTASKQVAEKSVATQELKVVEVVCSKSCSPARCCGRRFRRSRFFLRLRDRVSNVDNGHCLVRILSCSVWNKSSCVEAILRKGGHQSCVCHYLVAPDRRRGTEGSKIEATECAHSSCPIPTLTNRKHGGI